MNYRTAAKKKRRLAHVKRALGTFSSYDSTGNFSGSHIPWQPCREIDEEPRDPSHNTTRLSSY